jgi:predicted nucleic acid-binding protein
MIVIVETNFIIELALEQAEAEQVKSIVEWAEEKRINLAIPAFAFMEAYVNLALQSKRRNDIQNRLRAEIDQMSRSRAYVRLSQSPNSIIQALSSFDTEHRSKLAQVTQRLSAVSQLISVTDEVIEKIPERRDGLDLETGDACICACVECYARDLKGAASYFVTKDKDFERARGLLEAHQCRLITGFGAAFGAIREHAVQ